MKASLQPGATHAVDIKVDREMTAARFATENWESYPEVLATPFMLAVMERACAALLAPLLGDGQMSVGVRAELSHEAPTAVGMTVTAHARFVEKADPLFWFEVEVADNAGTVGRGRHARAIIDREPLEARAAKRAQHNRKAD